MPGVLSAPRPAGPVWLPWGPACLWPARLCLGCDQDLSQRCCTHSLPAGQLPGVCAASTGPFPSPGFSGGPPSMIPGTLPRLQPQNCVLRRTCSAVPIRELLSCLELSGPCLLSQDLSPPPPPSRPGLSPPACPGWLGQRSGLAAGQLPSATITEADLPLGGPGVRVQSRTAMCPGPRITLDGQRAGLPPGLGCAWQTQARAGEPNF